jgi:hypothetical protein
MREVRHQPIFCEILDTRTQKLVAGHPTLGRTCHFLVSNRIVSKVMAMVAMDRDEDAILDNLLAGDLSMCLRHAAFYVRSRETANFYTIMKRGLQLNQVAPSARAPGTVKRRRPDKRHFVGYLPRLSSDTKARRMCTTLKSIPKTSLPSRAGTITTSSFLLGTKRR